MVAMGIAPQICMNHCPPLGARRGERVGIAWETGVFVDIVNFVNFAGPLAPSVSDNAARFLRTRACHAAPSGAPMKGAPSTLQGAKLGPMASLNFLNLFGAHGA
jgi:hypothetical protein